MSFINAKLDLPMTDSFDDRSTLDGSGCPTPVILTPRSEGDFELPLVKETPRRAIAIMILNPQMRKAVAIWPHLRKQKLRS